MNIRNSRVLAAGALVVGTALGGGAYYAASSEADTPAIAPLAALASTQPVAEFAPPVVSVSSLTLPNRDSIGVVTRWTPKCRQGVCPQTYSVKVVLKNDLGYMTYHEGTYTNTRIVVPLAKPLCPFVDTALMQVASNTRGTVESSVHATAKLSLPCRNMTNAERAEQAALADSFPDEGHRMVIASSRHVKMSDSVRADILRGQLRAAKTQADSTKVRALWAAVAAGPDTVTVAQPADTLLMNVGYATHICMLARNRYTGEIVIVSGSLVHCEQARVAYATERNG